MDYLPNATTPEPVHVEVSGEVAGSASLPDDVRRLIQAAIAAGDPNAISTVIRLARITYPAAGALLDDIERRWMPTPAASAKIQGKSPKKASTQIELGATRATGRTSYLGVLGSVVMQGEGARWNHRTQARFELQKGRNVADVQRASASWQPGYKFGERLYFYALGQIESEARQGFHARLTSSGGLGYTVLKTRTAKLDLEGGPALRLVNQVAAETLTTFSTRASVNLRWTLLPTLELKQASSLYLEGENRSASAVTSIDAQVIGPLKARLSYDVRYERLAASSHLDTLGRATLVISF